MRIGRDVKFAHFFPHLSFILLCVSCILWISKKQSGSSDSSMEIRSGNYIPAHCSAQRLGPNMTSLFASCWSTTTLVSRVIPQDSPVLSIFSTSLNKPSSLDCSLYPKSTGLQQMLFNFTATAPNHLTFQGVIFCSSYQ